MFTAYYDLAYCPASYDVVSFLMWTERERIRKGADRVAIEILPGPWEGFRRDHNWPYTIGERVDLLFRVVVPMCRLLPSCERVEVRGKRVDKVLDSIGHSEYSISFQEFTKTYAQGTRPLRASPVIREPKLVTFTLRECQHWPERNSKADEWLKAARWLEKRGFQIEIVHDVAVDEAYTDLNARANLYARAALNLFVNNGPAWFALALDVPVMIFRPITNTTCWAHTAQAMKTCGIVEGLQMKGAPPHQVLCWLPETADNIAKMIYAHFFVEEAIHEAREARTEAH